MRRFGYILGAVVILAGAFMVTGAPGLETEYKYEVIDSVDQQSFDLNQVEYIGDKRVEYSVADDGHILVSVTDEKSTVPPCLHAMPVRGFYGFVTNNGSPVDANVAFSLRWSGTQRTTEDTQSCPFCGYYSKYCNVESGFGYMANLNAIGGHAPITGHGYRCSYDLIRKDIAFRVSLFYMKVCNPSSTL